MQGTWLAGKCLVIIGGTTGIGLSAARAFVREGANLVAIGRNEDSVASAAGELKGAVVETGDASLEGVALRAIRKCLAQFGGFDGLYHVAGGSGRKFGDGPLHELTRDGWDHTLSMNLTAMMLSNQAAVSVFLERESGGSILNMGSVLGYSPSPKYFVTHAYAAAKAAAIGFTRSVASYYAASNIRVNLLAPGLVETPMAKRAAADEDIMSFIHTKQPLDRGRIGVPTDLDGAAIYFMSDHSKFTTGQVLSVDGGWDISEGQYNHAR